MDETWDHHMSPLMMTAGASDLHAHQQSHLGGDLQNQDLHHHTTGGNVQQNHHLNNLDDNVESIGLIGGSGRIPGSGEHPSINHPDTVGIGQMSANHDYYGHQLLVSGQPTTTTTTNSGSSPASAGGGSLSPGGSSGIPGALSPGGTSSSNGAGGGGSGGGGGGGGPAQCCDSGRTLVTDPVSGQSVCSCQYDSARLAALQYPRSVGMYGTPYPSTEQNPYPSIGVESSAFYSPLGNPYGLKDASGAAEMSAWTSAGLQPTTGYYPYDPTLAAYGYSAGYDLAARRKNATRESTATLKAWLNEHKKNPYPTKGEKIMLAIITKMTLTQVSTWFANARRRLKKENKMTWEPKNKTDDDDDALVSDSDDKDKEDDDKRDDTDIHGRIKSERSNKDLDDDDITDEDRKDDILGNNMHHILSNGYALKSELKNTDCGVPLPPSKPKIWSLADTAACKTPPPPPPSQAGPWLGSSNGFALPTSRYTPNGGGFLTTHCQQGFPDVQTDTPPQTPPNMKLSAVPGGNMVPGNSCGIGGGSGMPPSAVVGYPQNTSNVFLSGFGGRIHSPQRLQQQQQQSQSAIQMNSAGNIVGDNSGFKPFYKSSQSMNGNFVSPV